MSLRLTRKIRKSITFEDGRILVQMMGAEGEGDPADDAPGDEDPDDDEDEDEPSSSKKSASSDEDLDKIKKRMRAADRRATAAEQRLAEKELEGKTELEQTKAKLDQAESANEELNKALTELRRERLFLGSNTVTWHDPEMAMGKLNWSDIIDEDGEVDGAALERSIKDLAKNKPFLVKKDSVEDDEDNRPPADGQPSGTKAGSGSKKKSPAAQSREALEKKYPALRR